MKGTCAFRSQITSSLSQPKYAVIFCRRFASRYFLIKLSYSIGKLGVLRSLSCFSGVLAGCLNKKALDHYTRHKLDPYLTFSSIKSRAASVSDEVYSIIGGKPTGRGDTAALLLLDSSRLLDFLIRVGVGSSAHCSARPLLHRLITRFFCNILNLIFMSIEFVFDA